MICEIDFSGRDRKHPLATRVPAGLQPAAAHRARRRRRRLAQALLAGTLCLGPAEASRAEEVIPFQSLTMTDQQFLSGDVSAAAKVELTGTLSLPENPGGPVPMVILLHGSGGPQSHHAWGWTKILNAIGIGTFAIDSYTGRGFEEIYTDQSRVGEFNNINDTFAALALLAQDSRIDRNRIAVMGFSRGGIPALYSAMERFQTLYGPPDVRLAAHLPFYPPCNFQLRDELDVGPAPIRAFHGDADDWNPLPRCKDYIDRLKAAGHDASISILPGARHSFDNLGGPAYTVFSDGQTSRNCLRIEKDGRLYNADTGQPFSWKDACVEMGPATHYNAEAMETTTEQVKDFLRERFKLK